MPCILSEIHSHEHLKFSISNKVKKKEEEIWLQFGLWRRKRNLRFRCWKYSYKG
jgi:hypothetical protein